jgi:hypothetical protein
LGAGLTYLLGVTESNFDNLWILVLIANVTSLLPLPLLNWLPDEQEINYKSNNNVDTSLSDRPEVVLQD